MNKKTKDKIEDWIDVRARKLSYFLQLVLLPLSGISVLYDVKPIITHGIKWKYIISNRYIEIAKTNYITLDVWTTSNQWIKSYYIDFMYYSMCIKIKRYEKA